MAIPLSPKTIVLMNQKPPQANDPGEISIYNGLSREGLPASAPRPATVRRRNMEPLASGLVTVFFVLLIVWILTH